MAPNEPNAPQPPDGTGKRKRSEDDPGQGKKPKLSHADEHAEGPSDAEPPGAAKPMHLDEPSESDDAPEASKAGGKAKRGLDKSLRPISDVREMFEDMVERLDPTALKSRPIKLNVATICSGTDAPIFALGLIQEALEATGFGAALEFEHLFSCEIEPFKQGFIRRNLPQGTLIFRDVVELASEKHLATTAGGSKAPIPKKPLDILFAGCSCVDYSNMNQNKITGSVPSLDRHLKRKVRGGASPVLRDPAFVNALDPGLDELRGLATGESARTFFAAVKLITVLNPKAIILENVYGAPWSMYTNRIFPKIGYVARCVKLDSKEFYLPQTRQRGYLVAVDASGIGETKAAQIASEWEVLILQCKRPPSVSISAFLRPPDDPATIQARADMESRSAGNAEWALCSLRHHDARRKHGLRRDDSPFSNKAMRNGRLIFASYPSHSWLRFWEGQVPRIVDLMDIAFAVALKQGADLAYKTGMIDVSQNVDRNNFTVAGRHATKKLGIVGCITPSGMPIVTDLMRPVTGTETLALQGLPVDELVISTETQAQLRDLAGNAMTVTVVGAAALALLLSVSETVPDLFTPIQSAQPRRGLYLEPPREESLAAGRPSGGTLAIGQLLATAIKMTRVCYCTTQADHVLVCQVCGITACPACRGAPEHHFGVEKADGPELSVEHGRLDLKKLLPNALVLPIPYSAMRHGLRRVEDNVYRLVVSELLAEEHVYYFDEIKVTEVVTVCYKAANSVARLVLSADSGCYWYIYVAPWHNWRPELSATFDLDQPVARGKFSEGARFLQWSVWALCRIDLTLQLIKDDSGALVASNLALAGEPDAHADASLLAWREVVEAEVHGTYVHHPKCGTAGNALRVKKTPDNTPVPKVFMMWESARLRDHTLDHFVWTNMVRRLEPHEYRETFLHASPDLSWHADSDSGVVDVFWPGYWSSPPDASQAPLATHPQAVEDLVQIRWGPAEMIRQVPCHASGQPLAAHMPVLAALSARFGQFPLSLARLSKMDSHQTGGSLYGIPAAGCDAFLSVFAFASKEVRLSNIPGNSALFPHLRGEWVPVDRCRDCSVAPPEIAVYAREDYKKGKKTNGEKKQTKDIIEDPDEAAKFERQFQDIPRAVSVAAKHLRDGHGWSTLDMVITLQPKTLASRALACLRQAHRTPTRGSLDLMADAKTFFTVTLDYAPPSGAVFAPFRDSLHPCGAEYSAGVDTRGPRAMQAGGPPRFYRDTRKGRKTVPVRHSLRPSQEAAVHWMLQREHAPLDFVKAEIEEEVVRPLNMRVTGKAEWATRFPYSSRGGVVAHEIGYGKTVVTLALIDYMRNFDQTGSIDERKQQVDGAWSKELPLPFEDFGGAEAVYEDLKPEAFFCHLSATLVIVPRHITDQWAKEAEKFLGLKRGPKLLVIKSLNSFHGGYTLEQLQQAEIIIVSSSVFGGNFLKGLQMIAGRGSDYPSGLAGRTLQLWYRQALRNLRVLTAYYLAGRAAHVSPKELKRRLSEELLPALVRKQQADIDKLVEKQVKEIDRQFYKKANRTTADAPAKQGDDGESKPAKGPREWDISWLHNCSFARIVWDECSYDDGPGNHIPLFVANAVANSKWLLSGTPKLFGLEEVCNVAASFGVHVARPEPRLMPGLPAVTKGPEFTQMSRSERFHVFSSPVKSASLARERHNRAQMFVQSYFRANVLERNLQVQFQEHVRPMAMTSLTSVRYHLLNQEVLDAGYDYTALPAHARAEVAITGDELAGRDGLAAAKMLLGLVACGLGRDKSSVKALTLELESRSRALCDQMKLLWDKAMWLRRWILELKPEDARFKFSDPVQDTLDRVDTLCDSLRSASLGGGDLEQFGGKTMFQREAAVVADVWTTMKTGPGDSHNTEPDQGSLEQRLQMRFREGWTEDYHVISAVYTWLDFFKVEPSALDCLTKEQLCLLAQDICLLGYKLNSDLRPLNRLLRFPRVDPRVEFLRNALATGGGGRHSLAIPPMHIKDRAANNRRVLDSVTENDVRIFLHDRIGAKPALDKWVEAKASFKVVGIPSGRKAKAALMDRLRECNLKFNESDGIDKLKEALWRHEKGIAGCENYRDGRAPPDRYRAFEAATGCGGTAVQQIAAANEELKHTMVHLTKTMEDLRSTWLEANFVPGHCRLAEADDTDDVIKSKACHSCQQPLESASRSFLVVCCGHFLCAECKNRAGFYCPVKDCPAFIRERPVLRCSQVHRPSEDAPRTKADCVADLIRNEIPKEEFVVVFAQYPPLIDALAKAFEDAGLEFTNLAAVDDDAISRTLEAFKVGKAGQVLLLDMDSETSAGSNLTIATRVIFANPYVHHDQEHQARTVKQARGRCIRMGQTKGVQVYHFMVPGTIEEETLRKFGTDSDAVKNFFATYEQVPWWLDGESGGGK